MTLDETMEKLRSLADEQTRQMNARGVAGEKHFGTRMSEKQLGVKMGDLRTLAKSIKADHELAMQLWGTGVDEAMLLALLIMKPKQLSTEQLDGMVRSAPAMQVADWLQSYVVKAHPQKEALRQKWMIDDDPMAARAGWSLTAERVEKSPDGLDLESLLDRIEKEMASAPVPTRWTMNFALGAIGINHAAYRERVLAIGEKLGVYRDYPASKGCTSPYVPIWVGEMVRRQS
ncbi:DNA alkylation repair protein [bacterium]|nr:MAG: DNA alkylation repair protein [bacterium]